MERNLFLESSSQLEADSTRLIEFPLPWVLFSTFRIGGPPKPKKPKKPHNPASTVSHSDRLSSLFFSSSLLLYLTDRCRWSLLPPLDFELQIRETSISAATTGASGLLLFFFFF